MRLVALADSDSYVKWAGALIGALRDDDASLFVVDSPLVVSEVQLTAALVGSGVERAERIELPHVVARLARERPDAVLVATTGPIARVLARLVAGLEPRPVIVTGLPGISIPATRKALAYRRQADLFVLHSRREIAEFGELAAARGMPQRFGLATLPFIERAPARGTDLVFAAQAIVPAERPERLLVAAMLREAALAHPERRVVVKVRAVAGEAQTHAERDGYPDLVASLGSVPPNLVVSAAPMSRALDTAEGLVTVSSTAALEALARDIPVIALDTFGVDAALINTVFVGSGLFGDRRAVVTREFRHPEPGWLDANYFHAPESDDWWPRLGELVAARRDGRLTPKTTGLSVGGRVRAAWDRKRAFGATDRSLGGRAALVVGVPLRAAVLVARRVRRRVNGRRPLPASTG